MYIQLTVFGGYLFFFFNIDNNEDLYDVENDDIEDIPMNEDIEQQATSEDDVDKYMDDLENEDDLENVNDLTNNGDDLVGEEIQAEHSDNEENHVVTQAGNETG